MVEQAAVVADIGLQSGVETSEHLVGPFLSVKD